MAHDENAVQIDFAVQRMSRGVIPDPKLFEVFEVNDRSAVVLSEVGSVEKFTSIVATTIPCDANNRHRYKYPGVEFSRGL